MGAPRFIRPGPSYLGQRLMGAVLIAVLAAGCSGGGGGTSATPNGQGNVLSRASVTQTVVLGGANTVTAVLNGVVASVTISLSNPAPNAGVPATVNVNVAAKDADGNTIVGPGDYSVPIHLAISDSTSSGTLSLSTNNLPNPATTATLTYNGGTLNSGLPGGPTATVVASGTGISTTSAAFTPKPTIYQFSIPVAANKPQYIAAGSDGNMWFTENPGNAIARITPAGVVTEFPIPTANAGADHIIGASDGNLWFTESGATANKIAKSTTTGTITEFATLFAPPPADQPFGLVDRGDGNIWYVANGSSRVGFLSYNGSTRRRDQHPDRELRTVRHRDRRPTTTSTTRKTTSTRSAGSTTCSPPKARSR